MHRVYLVLLILLSFNSYATSTLTPEGLFREISDFELISGEFKQRRYIKSLDTTLKSSGRFSMQKGKKITWEQTTPFAATTIITSEEKTNDPVIQNINHLILQVMGGDIRSLAGKFSIVIEGTHKQWQAQLKPKSQKLSDTLKSIAIKGTDHIQTIMVKESRGGYISIVLSNVKIQET